MIEYEPRVMDDSIECLSASEFQALVDYHMREQWVWDRVAKHTEDENDQALANYHRDAVRNMKELLAEEERLQTEFEEEQR